MRNLTSDQIIDLINSESTALGFYILEVNESHSGYSVCAAFDAVMSGHNTIIIFRRDILHVSRLYDREEVANIISILSKVYNNINKCFTPPNL